MLFCQELQELYHSVNPTFDKNEQSNTMLDVFCDAIGDEQIAESREDVAPYIIKHKAELVKIIGANSDRFIFNQPSFLLVYFALWRWSNRIIENWPYDHESLLAVVSWSGYSTDICCSA